MEEWKEGKSGRKGRVEGGKEGRREDGEKDLLLNLLTECRFERRNGL